MYSTEITQVKIFRVFLNCLPIIAIVFAILYVFSLGLNIEIRQFNTVLAVLSLFLLVLVFFAGAVLWHRILWRFGVEVSFRQALVSQLRTTLMKYIPGKVWVHLGRANAVSEHGYSLEYCSVISVFSQFLAIVSGLLVGMFGVLLFDFFVIPSLVFYILLVVLVLGVFLSAREFTIPSLNDRFVPRRLRSLLGQRIPPVADILLFSILHWMLLGAAYLTFIRAIGFEVDFSPVLLQPLANNIGILSYFAPGGLGVREGVMVGYLTWTGISGTEAMAISLAARLWFLVVEMFMFFIGWVVPARRMNCTTG